PGGESLDEANEFDAGLPGEKFADVLFDDRFRAGDFAFARLAILLHDVGEVVHVVDVDVVELGGGGFDVARKSKIHDEERAIAAGGHGGFLDVATPHRPHL